MSRLTLRKGMELGIIGGLLGTLVMDLFLVGIFVVAGMPADLTFSFIGDTATNFFSLIDIDMGGSVLLGALVHYLIGLGLGGIFGAAVSQIDAFPVNSLKQSVVLGIVYIEAISLPILITAPLLIEMTPADISQWFGLSVPMHLICGSVLGAVVSYGRQGSLDTAQHRRF